MQIMIENLQQQLSERPQISSEFQLGPVRLSSANSSTPEAAQSGGSELASGADESPICVTKDTVVPSNDIKTPITINISAASLSMMNGNGSMNIMSQIASSADSFPARSHPKFSFGVQQADEPFFEMNHPNSYSIGNEARSFAAPICDERSAVAIVQEID
jgi:hypothetical protein